MFAMLGRLNAIKRKRSPRGRPMAATKGGGGAVLLRCCSWRRLLGGRCQSGHRAYRVADLPTSSAPTLALFPVRLLREGHLETPPPGRPDGLTASPDSHARIST